MNKMRKKLSMVVLGVVLVMALSVTAFASSAWDSFSTKLPANQGDTEVSTVARASDSVDHFNTVSTTITPSVSGKWTPN